MSLSDWLEEVRTTAFYKTAGCEAFGRELQDKKTSEKAVFSMEYFLVYLDLGKEGVFFGQQHHKTGS